VIKAALQNTDINVITSKMRSHVPILQAPAGRGRIENFTNFNLSTYISATLFKKARRKHTGKARPNNVRKAY